MCATSCQKWLVSNGSKCVSRDLNHLVISSCPKAVAVRWGRQAGAVKGRRGSGSSSVESSTFRKNDDDTHMTPIRPPQFQPHIQLSHDRLPKNKHLKLTSHFWERKSKELQPQGKWRTAWNGVSEAESIPPTDSFPCCTQLFVSAKQQKSLVYVSSTIPLRDFENDSSLSSTQKKSISVLNATQAQAQYPDMWRESNHYFASYFSLTVKLTAT